MEFNPIGLSPLLVRRGGLVRAMVERWCKGAALCARAAADELSLRMPSGLEAPALPFQLLRRHADSLLAIGLWCVEKNQAIDLANVQAQVRELVVGLANSFVALCDRELTGLVEQYGLGVSDEEPAIGQATLAEVVLRRQQHAQGVVQRHRAALGVAADASALAADAGATLLEQLEQYINDYCAARGSLCSALVPPKYTADKRGRFTDESEMLMNQTVNLLRTEVLRDIAAATHSNELWGWGADRADRVSSIVTELGQRLSVLAGYAGAGIKTTYSTRAFREGRVVAFGKLLDTPPATAS